MASRGGSRQGALVVRKHPHQPDHRYAGTHAHLCTVCTSREPSGRKAWKYCRVPTSSLTLACASALSPAGIASNAMSCLNAARLMNSAALAALSFGTPMKFMWQWLPPLAWNARYLHAPPPDENKTIAASHYGTSSTQAEQQRAHRSKPTSSRPLDAYAARSASRSRATSATASGLSVTSLG